MNQTEKLHDWNPEKKKHLWNRCQEAGFKRTKSFRAPDRAARPWLTNNNPASYPANKAIISKSAAIP